MKGSTFLGVVNESGRATSTLMGFLAMDPGNLWQFPSQKMFIQFISVRHKKAEETVHLRLPSAVTQMLESADDNTLTAEQKTLTDILTKENFAPIFNCWRQPLKSVYVSRFGEARVLPSGESYFHKGIDLRAYNNPVYASGDGTVVYDKPMTLSGNQLIIEHGGGVFTRYLHLDHALVYTGQKVRVGEKIAISGNTGRVQAPHLHWEVIWRNRHADPLEFMKTWNQFCKR